MSEKHLKQPNKAESEKPEKKPLLKPLHFKQEDTPEQRMSKRDRVRVIIGFVVMLLLLAAVVVLWFMRGYFENDTLSVTVSAAPTADEEYLFDTSSGQCFASAGRGLAVATSSSLELLDGDGQVAASRLVQMETPAIAACENYAVFYDIGGLSVAAAFFDGTVRELTPAGTVFSASVSDGGYLTVCTESAGYRGLVSVYDPELEKIYEWYSSSAWIISAEVSPDGRSLAVVSYTAAGSEIRIFDLSKTEQQAAFTVSDTVLIDAHWFSASQLCAFSTDQAFFFGSDGIWTNTCDFEGKFLIDRAYGSGFVVFALSPYRAGSTATLVSYDAGGSLLGTADIQSELVSLAAGGTEILALCPDSAALYSSSLSQKGVLNGLTGFKYGLLRSRGEALLISSGYAEVHSF